MTSDSDLLTRGKALIDDLLLSEPDNHERWRLAMQLAEHCAAQACFESAEDIEAGLMPQIIPPPLKPPPR